MMRTSLRELVSTAEPEDLAAALQETGWFDLLVDERPDAVGLLFEEHGRALAYSRALDLLTAESLGFGFDAGRGFVYPVRLSAEVSDSSATIEIDGVTLGACDTTDLLSVILPAGNDSFLLASVPREIDGLVLRPIEGFDPELGWTAVQGQIDSAKVEMRSLEAGNDAADEVTMAMACSRNAIAHELVGLAEAMLAIGIDHVTERHQFGRAIGTFQTVKHRLADVKITITAAQLANELAWEESDPFSSALAKAQSGRAALLAANHVQQVCGAMGWTQEHGLHRFIRRVHVLDTLLGSSQAIQTRIGRRLLDTRSVPRVGGF
jgi:Acyl-CoA dehydrogenase, C-terminal domain